MLLYLRAPDKRAEEHAACLANMADEPYPGGAERGNGIKETHQSSSR